MEKQGTKFKLPEHLCESVDPLMKAKAYSLQLFILADQLGGKKMTTDLVEWLKNLDRTQLNTLSLKYEKQHRRAEKRIPYVRCSLLKHLKGQSDGGYKAQFQKSSEDVSVPLEVDGFLFEDLEDALRNASIRSDRFCGNCKSNRVTEIPINFISHSVESMINLFGVVLKDFQCRRIAVLGSKEGALVYGAFLFSDAEIIESYEVDHNFREIQGRVVNNFGMKSRVQIKPMKDFLHAGCSSEADILICDNVDEYDSEALQERINAFVTSQKVLVLKNQSGEELSPFFRDLLSQSNDETIMSSQEFVVKQ